MQPILSHQETLIYEMSDLTKKRHRLVSLLSQHVHSCPPAKIEEIQAIRRSLKKKIANKQLPMHRYYLLFSLATYRPNLWEEVQQLHKELSAYNLPKK